MPKVIRGSVQELIKESNIFKQSELMRLFAVGRTLSITADEVWEFLRYLDVTRARFLQVQWNVHGTPAFVVRGTEVNYGVMINNDVLRTMLFGNASISVHPDAVTQVVLAYAEKNAYHANEHFELNIIYNNHTNARLVFCAYE